MTNGKRWGAMAIALAISASLAMPAFAAEATVGQFVQDLARVKNLNATDARMAADSLRAAGVRLPSELDLGKRLTQADVAAIAQRLGLRVTTSRPDQAFDSEQVDQFFVSFAADLGATGSDDDNSTQSHGGGPFDPSTKGKGKHKGHTTPTSPE